MNTTFLRLLAAAALACVMTSCSTDGYDVTHPTVSQMDDMDVRWGLPKRVSRGTPKRLYSNTEATGGASSDSGTTAAAPAKTESQPAPAAAGGGTVSEEVKNKLR